jgi:hypothetical protein
MILGWIVLPVTEVQEPRKAFDWPGALLLAPALTLIVLVLNQISALGPASPVLIACIAAPIVLVFFFVRRERAAASPLVDLRLIERPAFLGGAVACALAYAILYGMFFVGAFALVRGYGNSSTLAGVKLAIIPVAISVVAPFSGGLSERLGTRALSVAGMALSTAALLMLSAFATDPSIHGPLGFIGLVGFGAGLGVFIAPNNHATINAAPSSLSGQAGAMLNLVRALGTSFGVAGASSMLSWRMQVASGSHDRRPAQFSERHLIEAAQSCLIMLAVFAVIAGAISLIRKTPAA